MIALIDAVYAAATIVALIGAAEQSRLERRIEASQQIEPGASQANVRDLLGAPTAEWETSGGFFGPGAPTWAYGTTVDLGGIVGYSTFLPDPLSFKWRIFGPYETDLVVTWDAQRRVESITRP